MTHLPTSALLAWISEHRRDLPWRHDRAPYTVWISEVMLQQTQAATVVPYFERWLARFPDMATLAAAPLDAVLKAWEGLGYYGRARHLHRAAQELMRRHGGRLPADRQALLDLPGIGPYTAGAILSLAFGQAEPVVDGNVRRVLCRVYNIAEDPRMPAVTRRLWELAAGLVAAAPVDRAGDLNEGLMELGALICTPTGPHCAKCPLEHLCLAHAAGVEAERPVQASRRPLPHHNVVAGVIQDAEGRYLLAQRPVEGLLGGLWGFPGGTVNPGEELAAGMERVIREQVSIEVTPQQSLLELKHAYTHFRITLHAFSCAWRTGAPQPLGYAAVAWAAAADLERYPLAVTDRRIAQWICGLSS